MTRAGRAFVKVGLPLVCALGLSACGADKPRAASEGAAPPGVAAVPRAAESSLGRTPTAAAGAVRPHESDPRLAEPRATRKLKSPRSWPSTLQIGLIDPEEGVPRLKASAPFGARWHYLSGGAGTTSSWTRWWTGDGSYASSYADDSHGGGMIPFLSYYVLQETPPASGQSTEPQKVVKGLQSSSVMRRVFGDLRVAFQRLAPSTANGPVVLQIEPDLWGYIQQRYGDDARNTPVRVSAAGAVAKGLPNNAAGLARAVMRIRNREAPNVLLAFPVSIFGTHKDIKTSNPDPAEVQRMIQRSVRFWKTAGQPFDLLTFEFANRNAGYQVAVDGVPRADAWWTPEDYRRHLSYVRGVLGAINRPGVLWQVPPGNTVSSEMDDTPGHYSDDKVQSLLAPRGRALLRGYRDAGISMVLFGSAFPNDTCACVRTDEHAREGGTPDDGGYLARQVRKYVGDGPLKLKRIPRRVGR